MGDPPPQNHRKTLAKEHERCPACVCDDGSFLEILVGLVVFFLALPALPIVAVLALLKDRDQEFSSTYWRIDLSDVIDTQEKQTQADAQTPSEQKPFWQYISMIIPRTTRLRVFEPAYDDLVRTSLIRLGESSGAWKTLGVKIWKNLCCFGLVFESLRVGMWAQIAHLVKFVLGPILSVLLATQDDSARPDD